MYDTIGDFMKSAKEIQIDSVHEFKVSKTQRVRADSRTRLKRLRSWKVGGRGGRSSLLLARSSIMQVGVSHSP